MITGFNFHRLSPARNLGIGICLNFLALCHGACGQQSISNKLTDQHANIAGTRVSIIPPEGFISSPTFTGLEQAESGSSIFVIETQGSFKAVSAGFTKEGLKTKGVEVVDRMEIKVNDEDGLLLKANQFAQGAMYGKYTLVFGNDRHAVIMNAAYPQQQEDILAESLRMALLTVVYETDKLLDPLATLPFKVSVSGTGLQANDLFANNLTFTHHKPGEAESADKAMLLVTRSVGNVVVEDKKQYSANRLKQYSTILNTKVDSIREVTIDQMSGFEIIGYGKDHKTSEPVLVYQVMLFTSNQYYLMLGTAKRDFPLNLQEFRKACFTFQRQF
jgi:hypothetical protein